MNVNVIGNVFSGPRCTAIVQPIILQVWHIQTDGRADIQADRHNTKLFACRETLRSTCCCSGGETERKRERDRTGARLMSCEIQLYRHYSPAFISPQTWITPRSYSATASQLYDILSDMTKTLPSTSMTKVEFSFYIFSFIKVLVIFYLMYLFCLIFSNFVVLVLLLCLYLCNIVIVLVEPVTK